MSGEIVQKTRTTYTVKELTNKPLPTGKQFSEIYTFYSAKKHPVEKAVLGLYDIDELIQHFNGLPQGFKKGEDGFLKGLYKGGTAGNYCYKTSKYLFFDIDVKHNVNTRLYKDRKANSDVYWWLYKRGVFVGRSNSGKGMFGAFIVEDISKFNYRDSMAHVNMAKAVYDHIASQIYKDLEVEVEFDPAQGKYRQVRYGAYQENKIELNKNSTTYFVEEHTELVTIADNLPDFKYTGFQGAAKGSIREKYNKDTNIEDLLPQAGLSHVSGRRWKYHLSSSPTSGEVKDNAFISNSTTFSETIQYFDPFLMTAKIKGYNRGQMIKWLRGQGYTDEEVDPVGAIPKEATPQQIWELAQPAKHLSLNKRIEFINKLRATSKQIEMFKHYLKVKNLEVRYDKRLVIKKWVSEKVDEIFDLADSKKKLLLSAETGTGKTTAIIDAFQKLRPAKKLLVIAPLTIIVDSVDGINPVKSLCRLRGTVDEKDWFKARKSDIVIATQIHAASLLERGIKFDYIVRDEIHSDIVGNSFRQQDISRLNYQLDKLDIPVIGLTGTPLNSFHKLGFYMVKLDNQAPADRIVQRVDNRKPEKIILQHQDEVKGRAIYRANSKDALELVRKILIQRGADPDSIVIFTGDADVKLGDAYKHLVKNGKFSPKVNIVLTTSVIDEGVSIHDLGFTDIVYIDADYYPRPEPLKQFINRFRLKSQDITYYHYRKSTEDQNYKDSRDDYQRDLELLEEDTPQDGVTVNSLASDKRMRYEDGSPNPYFLMYNETRHFFNSFNDDEFNKYLEANFNIEVILHLDYEEEEINVKRKSAKETRKKLTQYFKDKSYELEGAVAIITSEKSLKKSLANKAVPSQEVYDFAKSNKKTLETVYKALEVFEQISNDPKKLLLDQEELIDSSKNLKRKTQQLQTHLLLHHPKTYDEKRISKRVEKFLKGVHTQMRSNQIKDLWIKCNLIDYADASAYFYKDLIAINTPFVWDRNKTMLVEKETHPTVAESYMKDWLKELDNHFVYEELPDADEYKIKEEVKQYKIDFDV
ncbi:MAG: DEAD/DEAH box helicase family protein [Bacteroidota bacterium]